MKVTAVLCSDAPSLSRARVLDYVALTKPRIAVLVLFTVAAGVVLASGTAFDLLLMIHTVLGTALVAGGASALNQLIEKDSDGRMKRTASRPLPANRLQPIEVLVFGLTLGIGGTAYLALTLQQVWTPALAALTFVIYVCVYTPLKPVTTLNTLVGAVPGALPPVIGWVAARGRFDLGAASLFVIVFLWQIPHFLAIAWIYREDYGEAGLQMLPVVDTKGKRTGWTMIVFALVLLPAGLLPVLSGKVGLFYIIGSVLLGLSFLLSSIDFLRQTSEESARRVLRASLVYLPGLLALLVIEALWPPVVFALGG